MASTRSQNDPRYTAPDKDRGTGSRQRQRQILTEDVFGRHFEELGGKDLIRIMQQCERENNDALNVLRPYWARSYRAFHSRHFTSSKYTTDAYRARSKLFRPKTRSAVIKNLAAARTALMSTADAVAIRPEYEDDDFQRAGAKMVSELVNYRFDRTSRRGGIPWMRVALGANFDAQITGICASKQSWDYRCVTVKTIRRQPRKVPVFDETGMMVQDPVIDPATGQPQIDPMTGSPTLQPRMGDLIDEETGEPEMEEFHEQKERILANRPWIENLAPERVWLDLGAHWIDPIQLGSYAIIRFPMLVGDAKAMMAEKRPKAPTVWLDVSDEEWANSSRDYDEHGIRTERQGRVSQRDALSGTRGQAPDPDFQIVWLHENFFRWGGIDYTWWSLGTDRIISVIDYTHEIYPWAQGQRPLSYGVAAIEPHVIVPQSPVEGLQPIQQEMNDLANLRLDAVKQSVEPVTKIKTGSIFDVKQLRQRGAAGANIQVRNMEDMEYMITPGPGGQTYAEMDRLNADFDDLAAVFSGGSVSTNRQLNETVGGMRMLSGAANTLTEYNLSVWAETWAEPTVRQVAQLEQWYETDETVLMVCGQRAKLPRYGVSEITDELLENEVMVSVNIGAGAGDPVQKLQRLSMSFQTMGMLAPFADRTVKVNMEEAAMEIMGGAGYKEGMRFFIMGPPGEMPPNPEQIKAEMEAASKAADNASREKISTITSQAALAKQDKADMAALIRTIIEEQGELTREQVRLSAQKESEARQAGERMVSGALDRGHKERLEATRSKNRGGK